MGHLKNGVWHNDDVATSDKDGNFDREKSDFRSTISAEHECYQPDDQRYHLYVSYACPWAHRTLIVRALKKLENSLSVSVVHPDMLDQGWSFRKDFDGTTGDELYGSKHLYEIYQQSDAHVTTKVTVPVLWDKKTKSIVNNESSEIIRILNSSFPSLASSEVDLYPEHLRGEIDKMNERTYEPVNNGVYKAGFAKNQEAYNKAAEELFTTLDSLEEHLQTRSFLVGEQLTEADVRLLTTLLRFDAVYYVHFKCNIRKISEYPCLWAYTKKLYELEAVRSTTNLSHIKRHYYYSHDFINPYRIVPLGPSAELGFSK